MLFGILPKYQSKKAKLTFTLPKYQSKKAKLTFTLKQNYIPWDLRIKESPFSINPLTCGMYVNTVFGDDFWVNEPDRYPKGYYGFSSKIRFHVFLGQRVTFNIDQKHRFMAKQISQSVLRNQHMRPLRDKRIYQQISETQRLPEPFIRHKDAADINRMYAAD